MDWNDLQFFLAVAQTKTLSGAATLLRVSPSTVSRRVETLESALDVQLFRAHRDGYTLTPAGADLVPFAEQAGAQIRVFERNARERDKDYSGPVCIEAPELLGQEVILPMLDGLMQRYPEIRIELRNSVRPLRLTAGDTDIVLRLVRPTQGPYKIRKLGEVSFGLYASSDYIDRYGSPTVPAELHEHRIIGWSEELYYLTMNRWLDDFCPGLQPILRLSSLSAQLVAARCNFGWAVLPAFAAEPAGLVSCLASVSAFDPDLWLLVREQSETLPRVAVVRDHLIHTISKDSRLLSEIAL